MLIGLPVPSCIMRMTASTPASILFTRWSQYYDNIHKTDNHGSIALLNNETGKTILCNGSIAFFDDVRKGSYEDYIFTAVSADTLGDYELYGDFVTSSGSVEGNWSVTFPLENTLDE